MHQYIIDTEYAVRGIIDLITAEEILTAQLHRQYEGLSSKESYLSKSLQDAPYSEDVNPFQEQAIAIALYDTREALADLKKKIMELQKSIQAKGVSLDTLCGGLLQIAKQGISIVYGGLAGCPDGRSIGIGAETEKLKNVIWQARNQSMHYEEGNFKPSLIDCFAKLEASYGNKFSLTLNVGKNLAHDVIQELGWKDYSKYESDIQSLI